MNITFNGTVLNDLMYIRSIQGLGMPQTIDRVLTMANGNGAFYSCTDFDQRVVTLDVSLIHSQEKSVYQRLDELKTLLSPYAGERELILGAYPDRYLKARYSGNMDIEQIGMLQNFPITFMCADPLFYELALQNIAITAGIDTALTNKGSAPTQDIVLRLTLAPSQQVTIQNMTTNKSLVIKNPDASEKLIRIDFKHASITDQSQIQNYNKVFISGEFFSLNPGVNTVKVSAGTVVSAQFRSAWV